MALRLDELREKDPRAELKKQWTTYERISVNLKRAVVAAEDAKFSEHEGFDWEGIQKALEKNQKKGRIVAGGSTISQQLAKNLFLSGSKTPWRKAQEAVITLMLETLWATRRLLEVYLNVRLRRRGRRPPLLRRRRRPALGRAGGAARRAAAQPAQVRPPAQLALSRRPQPGHPRPHELGGHPII